MPPVSRAEEDATGPDGGVVAVDELPAGIEAFLGEAGVEWPYLNEGAVRRFVRALRVFRRGMLEIHLDATDSLARIAREQLPEGAEETLADWGAHAGAFVSGVAAEIEAFCRVVEDWVRAVAADKAVLLDQVRGLAEEAGDRLPGGGRPGGDFPGGDFLSAADRGQCAKDLIAELETRLGDEAREMFGERLQPLLARIAESGSSMAGTSGLLRGQGKFAPGADLETVYLHIDRFRTFADAMRDCARTLTASMSGLSFGARPGPDDLAEPEPDGAPMEGYAVWRGHVYRAERVTHSAVRLSLLPGDPRPPVAPELGGWPYTGSLLLWPAQLDAWFGPAAAGLAATGPARRADLLEVWRLRFAEEAFRYFTPPFAPSFAPPFAPSEDLAPGSSGTAAEGEFVVGPFVVGEFARWRGRLYGAQTMPDDSARLFPLPGDDRTPVVPDLARHARGLWASPIELEEWFAVCTTFYVGDDAYLALSLADGVVEGMRAYTAEPERERFPVGRVVDLQEERRDLLAEWKRKSGIWSGV